MGEPSARDPPGTHKRTNTRTEKSQTRPHSACLIYFPTRGVGQRPVTNKQTNKQTNNRDLYVAPPPPRLAPPRPAPPRLALSRPASPCLASTNIYLHIYIHISVTFVFSLRSGLLGTSSSSSSDAQLKTSSQDMPLARKVLEPPPQHINGN